MKRRARSILSLILLSPLLVACRDGVGADLRGAYVRIYIDENPYDEQTIAPGDVLPLNARVFDATGKEIPGLGVDWSSTSPEVASVDGAGVVKGATIGTAHIVARHSVGEATARINVAAPVTGSPTCSPAQDLALSVGEIRIFSGEEAVLLCLPGGETGAEYILTAVNTGTAATSILPLRQTVTRTGPSASAEVARTYPDRVDPLEDPVFHERIRQRHSRELEPLLRDAEARSALAEVAARQYTLDQQVSLYAGSGSGPCEPTNPRTGRVAHVTERAVIIEDTQNPADGFTASDYASFGAFFDGWAWPLITETFGEPSDIDGNGKVLIFFTVAVNELPENRGDGGTFVGGYFHNRDLFATRTCAASNAAEMFYVFVPDPTGQPGGRRPFPASFVRPKVPTLLVHEFQHLVNDSRRLHVNQSPIWEETWLNEGLSHIAEELMFFRRSGIPQGSNVDASRIASTTESRDAFRSFMVDNLDRLTPFLENPEAASLIGADLLTTRGAAWYFLRYTADRMPGGEGVLWDRLVRTTKQSGFDNLTQALGGDPRDRIRDWAVAVHADDLLAHADHDVRSWNFRSIYPALGSLVQGRTNRPYPLRIVSVNPGDTRQLNLQGGGTGYSRVDAPAGGRAAVRSVIGDTRPLPPPHRLKVAVARVR